MRELKPEDIKFDENSLILKWIKSLKFSLEEMESLCGVPKKYFGAKARAKGFSRIPNGEEEDET